MRKSLTLGLITLLLSGTYWYQTTASVCPVPLTYRVGEVDGFFGVTEAEVLDYVKQAEDLWEETVERDLFVYDAEADFTINFVYDERQEIADSEYALRADLDRQKTENDKILATVAELQQKYEELSANYQSKTATYEKRLSEYNAEVNKYNDRGGAPADVYAELEKTRADLNNEAEELTVTADTLNELVASINELSERGNKLVEAYNIEVKQYNKEFGFSREFTQGDHQGDEINIYKFSETNELITVLAHEFGHALGIGHVEDSSSLMYYLLEDTSRHPELAVADIEAYQAVCSTAETLSQKVRHQIRVILEIF